MSSFFNMCLPLGVGVENVQKSKAVNTNIYETRMMFFKGYIKIRATAAPIKN